MSVKNVPYKELVVYQIWPRSFCDGNGDGIGDLTGIYSKLEYIKSLGANAIWFSPLYLSPQKDYGYDIADYYSIAPEYGTMEDFKKVLNKAHQLGMYVIMDLVINHTSNQHKWFLESRKGDNEYRDYYIWRKGKGKDGKKFPNNWTSTFPGDGWEYDELRKEYYLHLFAVEQPDLNMDNPKVRNEVKKIMRFYLDMGVDGFREDVINFISKREGLPNGFPIPAARGMEHYKNGPHIHEYLQEFKEVWQEYGAFTVGEGPMVTPKVALSYLKEGDKQDLSMMFSFEHMSADGFIISWLRRPFNLRKLKRILNNWQTKLYNKGWNALFLENHDQSRIISRYGSEEFRVESGKALATMYMMLCGTPFIYQGQEIGMLNANFTKPTDYVDVNTFAFHDLLRKLKFSEKKIWELASYAARDNARTVMQWNDSENGGFSDAKPWYYLNPNYKEINVEDALKDEDSILNFYRELINIRKENKVAIYGDFVLYDKRSKKQFVYARNYEGKRLLVMISFSKENTPIKVPNGFELSKGKLLITNYKTMLVDMLLPYECRVYLFD